MLNKPTQLYYHTLPQKKPASVFARKCIDEKLCDNFAEYFILLIFQSLETEILKRFVYLSRAKLNNELPVQIRQLDSFEVFRKSINTIFD